MKKIKLFCFPWAGGSATLFYTWRKFLNSSIELIPVELSGRGCRHTAPLYSTLEDAVDDTFSFIKDQFDGTPYAFFGHSMGSLIAFELSHKIKSVGAKEPVYIFMSGRWAPDIIKENQINYSMSGEELKKVMISLGGTSEDLFENEKLFNAFIPVLKSDLKIIEEYKYIERDKKLISGLTAMTGASDASITNRDLLEWQKHIDGEFNICKFKGGHFYINESREAVVKSIGNKLTSIGHMI